MEIFRVIYFRKIIEMGNFIYESSVLKLSFINGNG